MVRLRLCISLEYFFILLLIRFTCVNDLILWIKLCRYDEVLRKGGYKRYLSRRPEFAKASEHSEQAQTSKRNTITQYFAPVRTLASGLFVVPPMLRSSGCDVCGAPLAHPLGPPLAQPQGDLADSMWQLASLVTAALVTNEQAPTTDMGFTGIDASTGFSSADDFLCLECRLAQEQAAALQHFGALQRSETSKSQLNAVHCT